ncbi:MAG: hypothetical protein DRP74_09035, partial [Candidatus Omnitrophota bacterium]
MKEIKFQGRVLLTVAICWLTGYWIILVLNLVAIPLTTEQIRILLIAVGTNCIPFLALFLGICKRMFIPLQAFCDKQEQAQEMDENFLIDIQAYVITLPLKMALLCWLTCAIPGAIVLWSLLKIGYLWPLYAVCFAIQTFGVTYVGGSMMVFHFGRMSLTEVAELISARAGYVKTERRLPKITIFSKMMVTFTALAVMVALFAGLTGYCRSLQILERQLKSQAEQMLSDAKKKIRLLPAQVFDEGSSPSMRDIIRATRLGDSGYSFLVNRRGQIITHSDETKASGVIKDEFSKEISEAILKGKPGSLKDIKSNRMFVYVPYKETVIVTAFTLDDFVKITLLLRNMVILAICLLPFLNGLVAFPALSALVMTAHRVVEGSKRVALGDLTRKVSFTAGDEIGEVAKWFNIFVVGISNIIRRVSLAADKVSSSSQALSSSAQQMNATTVEISSTIQQISKGTTTQSQRVEETRKLMQEMTGGVKQVVSNVQAGAKGSEEAVKR